MLGIITLIGYGLVIFLCLFALAVIYFCFRGGIGRKATGTKRNVGGRILDRTAWGINGLACLWVALRHRHRLFNFVELSFANPPDELNADMPHKFTDTGEVVPLLEGMVVVSYVFPEHPEGRTLYVRRPFRFLERDWMESMGFRRNDGVAS